MHHPRARPTRAARRRLDDLRCRQPMSGVENEKQKSLLRPAMVEGKDYGYFRGLTHGMLIGLAIAVMLCALLSGS